MPVNCPSKPGLGLRIQLPIFGAPDSDLKPIRSRSETPKNNRLRSGCHTVDLYLNVGDVLRYLTIKSIPIQPKSYCRSSAAKLLTYLIINMFKYRNKFTCFNLSTLINKFSWSSYNYFPLIQQKCSLGIYTDF